MYIFQQTYKECRCLKSRDHQRTLLVVLPSSPQQEMTRFTQIIQNCIRKINDMQDSNWAMEILSNKNANRSAFSNYMSIYNADIVVAECTERKPNVFYLLGLTHAIGRPVCSCFKIIDNRTVDIPFNVHGRQSLIYSLSTIDRQREFENKLVEWVKTYV